MVEAAMTGLTVKDARCEALFAAPLRPSDTPTAEAAAEAISRAVQEFGVRRLRRAGWRRSSATTPEEVRDRMRSVRQLAGGASSPAARGGGRPAAESTRSTA
jgi:hypothetical protein